MATLSALAALVVLAALVAQSWLFGLRYGYLIFAHAECSGVGSATLLMSRLERYSRFFRQSS